MDTLAGDGERDARLDVQLTELLGVANVQLTELMAVADVQLTELLGSVDAAADDDSAEDKVASKSGR